MALTKQHKIFVRACIAILGLDAKITVKIKPGKYFTHKELNEYKLEGIQWELITKKPSFLIWVARAPDRGWHEVMAHELVHAWVDINHPKAKMHGRTFQRTCAGLRKALEFHGYHLQPLFLKGTDK